MSNRTSSAKIRFVPASDIRTALGDALGRIRAEDKLTWEQFAEYLGKGDDQAVRYVDATAEMPVTVFYRAKQAWNGRFTGDADKLIEEAVEEHDPHHTQSCILRAALSLSVALEDGSMSDEEIRANRATLESAKDSIDRLLARLTPRVSA